MFTFSQQLRNECIAYFQEIHGIEINQEKADRYLGSLAELFEAVLDFHE